MASFNELSYSWLDDFDWSLRMVMSSDKLSDLHKPLLMLKLEKTDANGEKSDQLIELTAEELKFLIAKLKTVQKVCIFVFMLCCSVVRFMFKINYTLLYRMGFYNISFYNSCFVLCICQTVHNMKK
jgi:hypothetical protein